MENRDTDDEGVRGPRDKPQPGGGQKGGENERKREGQEGDKESLRPSPSGVPNEGRARDVKQGQHQGGRQGRHHYEFKGGRQAQGTVPNPDDPDDHESAGSFRGTADKPGANDKTRNPA